MWNAWIGYRTAFGRLHDARPEDATSAAGRVLGTYLHGLFGLSAQRSALLVRYRVEGGGLDHYASIDPALDDIADGLQDCRKVDGQPAIAGEAGQSRSSMAPPRTRRGAGSCRPTAPG